MTHYNYCILQEGTLPLRPNGKSIYGVEHRCTTALIWPQDERPSTRNTLVTDPCFTNAGFTDAAIQLKQLGLTIADIGYYFVTHEHGDHLPDVPPRPPFPEWLNWDDVDVDFPDLDSIPCPGHDPFLQALVFRSSRDETVWIVGDAVLNLEWLERWQYYWPNGYTDSEVVEHWRSVAKILAADVIIPGHGAPIYVTRALLGHLRATFPLAEYAAQCPDVLGAIKARLQR
jgi:glyoxylase-like metal-dependent hydrolase (beta-lactamase superfamily II)